MSIYNYQYEGYQVAIDLDVDDKGRWTWSFLINGKHYAESSAPLRNNRAVFRDAKLHAERAVDLLPPVV